MTVAGRPMADPACPRLYDSISRQLLSISSFLSFLSALDYKMRERQRVCIGVNCSDMRYIELNISAWLLIRQRVFCFFLFISESARKLETGKASRICWSIAACVGKLSSNIHPSFLWIDCLYVFVCTHVQKVSLWFLYVTTWEKEWRKCTVSLLYRLFSFTDLILRIYIGIVSCLKMCFAI